MSQEITNDTKKPDVWTGGPCTKCGAEYMQAVDTGIISLYYAEISEDGVALLLSHSDTIYDGSELTEYLECRMCLTEYQYPDLPIEYT